MKNLTKIAFAVSLMTLSSAAISATADGTEGATSTATFDVTLTLSEQVMVSELAGNMGGFLFGAYGGAGDLTATQDICVYHNGDGVYDITISDDSATAGFNVEDAGDTTAITMDVVFNDEQGVLGIPTTMAEATKIFGQTAANTTNQDCSAGIGMSASIEVTLAALDLQAAPAGAYDAQLTLLVEPN
ncbi:MAG: hypothetical protein COA99_16230 [Moraxellaceae bacterium]|nr:MAG: hypothetical protein COA99_16230 [Moraxellaceae bacterium]